MLQPEFVKNILALCKQRGIHTALETCAVYDYGKLDGIRENVDLFLVDYKATGAQAYKECTGADNHFVLENLQKLHDDGFNVLIRCPIIPGQKRYARTFQKNCRIDSYLSQFYRGRALPYHRLGVSKIDRFGLDNQLPHREFVTPDKDTVLRWVDTVRRYGGRLVNED